MQLELLCILVNSYYQIQKRNLANSLIMSDSKDCTKTIKENYERYQLAVSAANIGIWDWEIPTNTLYYSEIWKSQIGYLDHELDNELSTWINHLHPDESEEVIQKVEKYIENPIGKYVSEFRFRHKNGSYIWILAKSESLKNEDGEVIRLFGSHTDITKRKEVEQRLEAIYKQ